MHALLGGRPVLSEGIHHQAVEFGIMGADVADRAASTDEAIELVQGPWLGTGARYENGSAT